MDVIEPVSLPPPPPPPEQPSVEECLILRPDVVRRFDFAAIFPSAGPVELELGAGDGSFILAHAERHPDRNLLAVERLLGRLRKIDRKGRRAGLRNLRALRLEAGYVLHWMVPPGSLSALHVYFPDPWPKRRHWKRRLVGPEFVTDAARALAPGGCLHLRTDHPGYSEWMEEVLVPRDEFRRVDPPADLLAVKTDFEAGFNAEGIPTRASSWERRPE